MCGQGLAYGNRMADHHIAHDGSPRHTYRHVLGQPLTPGNSGALQWGDGIAGRSGAGEEYRALHVAVWTEARRVLKPRGIFVLNVKDHIRGGVVGPLTGMRWDGDVIHVRTPSPRTHQVVGVTRHTKTRSALERAHRNNSATAMSVRSRFRGCGSNAGPEAVPFG
jgi:hypothetical protein